MNPDFFISVIVPVHNGAAFLADAVESIQRQGDAPLEIIIVDDGSTDGTAQLIPRLTGNIRAAAQSNRGPAAARNTGLRMARGNVIGFLDADDLWPANKLALQLACLADHPDIGIVHGSIQCIRTKDEGRRTKNETFSDPYLGLQLGSALCRA
ncbi:MAG: glycosyltransferase family 2 protein, partial [Candidatus Latescibacteria bacterium]|nr:glycosyltransferase family 2 protein [Candidatus Latescibacterota bacterium]